MYSPQQIKAATNPCQAEQALQQCTATDIEQGSRTALIPNSDQTLQHSWLHTAAYPVFALLTGRVVASTGSYMWLQLEAGRVHEGPERCLPFVYRGQAPDT